MSQYAAELCTLLVEETYGQLYARIFSTLLRDGRLDFPNLLRRTKLSPRQLKFGLAILIHQHLIYHHSDNDRSSTFYEADWKHTYSLVRAGKIVQCTQERFGTQAANLISMLLELGHARVGDLLNSKELIPETVQKSPQVKNLPNGIDKNNHITNGEGHANPDEPYNTLKTLAEHGFISRVRPAHFRSPTDNLTMAEKVVSARLQKEVDRAASQKTTKAKTTKKIPQAEIGDGVKKLLEEWYDGRIFTDQLLNGSSLGRKRAREEPKIQRGRKRTRVDDGLEQFTNGKSDEEKEAKDNLPSSKPLSDDLVIHVNHAKYVVAFRTIALTSLVDERIGKTTGQVYEALLTTIEGKLSRCRGTNDVYSEDSHPSPPALIHHVRDKLDPGLDLATAIGSTDLRTTEINGNGPVKDQKGKRKVTDGEAEEDGDASSDELSERQRESEDEPISDIEHESNDPLVQHLHILSSSPPHPFCQNLPLEPKKWVVPFRQLTQSLLYSLLRNVITERFDPSSARLASILLTLDPNTPTLRLSENQLVTRALLPSKTVRSCLARMHAAHFLGLQEVPRDAQRQPARTIYLWYFDTEHVRRVLEDECHKTMARLIRRAQHEREKRKGLLEKCERDDVKGNEADYLTQGEKKGLKDWRTVESRLWGQIGRLDDMIMVLKEF